MNVVDVALIVATQHLLQSAVLFVVALLLMRLRALGAEMRSWLLLAVFALAVALPFVSFLPGPSAASLPVAAADASRLVPLPSEGARLDEPVYEAGQSPDVLYLQIPRSLSSLLALAWAIGLLWQWMRLVDGWRQARRLRAGARPAPALETALAHVLPRRARIATTAADGPMVVGLLRPWILLPRALAQTLPPPALHDVLRHEIAHIRRGDLWLVAALRAALAVFWWNPFLRLIGAQLELAREMACDARAAQGRGDRTDYADSLLASVEALLELGERRDSLAVGIFEQRSHLAQRIDGLVDDEAVVGSTRRRLTVAACVSVLAACAGLALAAVPRFDFPAHATAEPDARVTALLTAARSGDRDAVRELVAGGVDIDARVLHTGTPLIQAVRSGDLDTVDALLDLGADPDRAALGEGNPLIVASRLGLQPIVERLVEAKADVNRVVTYDETPLINAARAGHLATVRFLVAHGADVNLGVEADGWLGRWRTPLNQAGDAAVRAYLIERGARVERR